MDIIISNLAWMSFNVILALIPIVFGIIMYQNKNIIVKAVAGLIWFFFLPNTIYLTTDIINFLKDVKRISGVFLAIDLALYLFLIVIGVITFIMAIDPFERMLFKDKSKKIIEQNLPIIYVLNFFVGFGVVLGRIHRLNSWDVFVDTQRVIFYSLETLRSLKLMILVFAFAILSQFVYVKFRKSVPKITP